MALTDGIRMAGRIIVCDNFFSSINLGQTLFAARTYILGTIRANRARNPVAFFRERLAAGQHKYIFSGVATLLKLQVRANKMCHLFSSYHHGFATSLNSNKPMMIQDYNTYKCGTDILDMMVEGYMYYPKYNFSNFFLIFRSRRWPIKMFSWLVQIAGINAYVMWKKTHPNSNVSRREFLFVLSQQLMDPQVQRRNDSDHWISRAFRTIFAGYRNLRARFGGTAPSVRFWCNLCQRNRRDEAIPRCRRCQRNACLECQTANVICRDCYLQL